MNHTNIYAMARNGEKLPTGTRIRTTQGGVLTGETHEVNLENANKISEAFSAPRPFWCYGWCDLHDSLILPDNAPSGRTEVRGSAKSFVETDKDMP